MEYKYTREEIIKWIRLNAQLVENDQYEIYWVNNFTAFYNVLFECTNNKNKSPKIFFDRTFVFERELFSFHLIRMDFFEEFFLLESGYLIGELTLNNFLKQHTNCNLIAKRYSGLCKECIIPGNIKLKEHLIWLIKEYKKIFKEY